MTNVQCEQCGLINRLARENCEGCGAELRDAVPSPAPSTADDTSRPVDLQSSDAKHGEYQFSPAIGPFTGLGAVLNPTITLFKDNFWLITKIVVVLFAPFEIFQALSVGANDADWQVMVGVFFLAVFCKALIAPSLIYALVTVMRTGVAPRLNEAYRWGLSRIGKVVAVTLLAWTLQLLGFICLIIPGIILSLAFELIYPMAALENRTPVEILKRSYNLTKGYKGEIFVAGFVLGLLLAVINIPASMVSAFLVEGSINYWPLRAALAMVTDFVNEATTVLSLVIYISILSTTRSDYGIATNLPPPPPAWE